MLTEENQISRKKSCPTTNVAWTHLVANPILLTSVVPQDWTYKLHNINLGVHLIFFHTETLTVFAIYVQSFVLNLVAFL